jgi:hypothetical protein
MPIIPDYKPFGGLHPETATVKGVLTNLGARAPHTGEPYSEALLLGLSGGIGAMYFVFEYPEFTQFYFTTRRVKPKVDAVDELCKRLGLTPKVMQTASAPKAAKDLAAGLAEGQPVIVWADRMSLPYNLEQPMPGMGWMQPVVVCGLEGDAAYIDDRSTQPLTVSAAGLAAARGNYNQTKHKAMTLGQVPAPDLPAAVVDAIRTCVRGFTEPPMANFGLPAIRKWADLLTHPKEKKGWPALFGPGYALYANLKKAFQYIELEGTGGGGARWLYADFLDEAATVLPAQPGIKEAADIFRQAAAQWTALADSALPGALQETATLLRRKEALFRAQGQGALPEMEAVQARLDELSAAAKAAPPLSEGEAADVRMAMRDHLLAIAELEEHAVRLMAQR